MTTETPNKIAEIEARLTTARENLAKAQSEAAEKSAAFMALPEPKDYAVLAEIGKPAAVASAVVTSVEAELSKARESDRWETNIAIREPVLDGIREMLIDNAPTVAISSYAGRLTIGKVGDAETESASVKLTPTMSKIDLSSIEAAIASTVDVAAFKAAGFLDVVVSVTGLDGDKPVISLAPASAVNAAGKSAAPKATKADSEKTERSGPLQWLYAGEWLSSREMLEAVKASTGSDEEAQVAAHPVAFENALAPGGQGMSNLAKQVGGFAGMEEGSLRLEYRNKPKSE